MKKLITATIAALAMAATSAMALEFTSDPSRMEIFGKFRYNGYVYAVTNLRCQLPNMTGLTFSASRIDLRRGIAQRGCGTITTVHAGNRKHFELSFVVNDKGEMETEFIDPNEASTY